MLRNRSPKRFAADSLVNANASTTSELARLKREWRAEWEAERAGNRREAIEGINRKLDLMRERRIAQMSPRVRAAWDALQQAQAEEEANRNPALPAPDEPDGDEA